MSRPPDSKLHTMDIRTRLTMNIISTSRHLPHIALLFVLILTSTAALSRATSSLENQRKYFVDAERALKRNDMSRYRPLKRKLADYPLLPYLTYDELQKRIKKLKSTEAEQFLTDNSESPLASRFRAIWLRELARRKQWWTYRTFYRADSGTELQCHQLTALLNTGKKELAFAQIPDLWLVGKSQPKACDPAFDAWRAAGKLTQTWVWQRIELAMDEGNLSLARYLSRFLDKAHRKAYEQWVKVYQDPAKNLGTLTASKKPIDHSVIWVSGFKRLARKDINRALQVWRSHTKKIQLSAEQSYTAQRYLTLRLLYADHPRTDEYLTAFQPNEDDQSFIERRLRHALSKGDWAAVQEWIEASPEETKTAERWQYWLAIAQEKLGHGKEAQPLFETLSKQRSYHGFLAADHIGAEYNLNHTPVDVDSARINAIRTLPAMQRTRELIALERYTPARREWYLAIRNMNNDALQGAAKIAQSWGWNNQAIFTLARTGYWEDLELRFPIKHLQQVQRQATKNKLDSAWIYAVIRQESAFGPNAQSRVGAMGLMQLMPATARSVAQKLKQRRPKKWELLRPTLNIQLGTAYLRQVLDQLHDHQVLATAAYNAGPHRVKSWLPKKTLSADQWVETIPFNETRKYTERVMAYSVIYEQRLGGKATRLNQRMSPIQPDSITTVSRGSTPST